MAHERSQEELTPPEDKGGSREELTVIRGKKQRLHIAGAGVKREPMSKVRETQVRW